jgi:Tfp pilus assembly protein PilF
MKLMDARKLDEALAEATTAIDVAPNRPLAHAVRAKILVAMGRKEEALEESGKVKSTVTNILAMQGSR